MREKEHKITSKHLIKHCTHAIALVPILLQDFVTFRRTCSLAMNQSVKRRRLICVSFFFFNAIPAANTLIGHPGNVAH